MPRVQLPATTPTVNDRDSFPFATIDMYGSPTSAFLQASLNEAPVDESMNERADWVQLARGTESLFDRWTSVEIRAGLSTGNDGFITVRFDGKEYRTFQGRTLNAGDTLEVRYGIYHTGTNRHPGGAANVPTQVVYYGNFGVFHQF